MLAYQSHCDGVEVKRTAQSVDKRKAHHEDGGGEHGGEDIFHRSLAALIAVLVKGHHCSQRQRSGLEADHEEQEVTCRHHEIHAEERHEQQLVKLTAAHGKHVGARPPQSLYHHDERSDVENVLDADHSLARAIHAAEGLFAPHGYAGHEAQGREDGEEHAAHHPHGALAALRHERVKEEHQDEYGQQTDFLSHYQKL